MTLSKKDFDIFSGYIDEVRKHRERECQKYLIHAANYLFPGTPSRIEAVQEERNFFGRSDFVIAADIKDDTNHVSRQAYIWELKSPQCYLFELDNNNRCKPTSQFLKGENQLLHYFHEAEGNHRFRQRMGVIDQNNIRIGGLVIGTHARMLKGSNEVNKAETALRVRQNYLYKNNGLRIITWDRIREFLE